MRSQRLREAWSQTAEMGPMQREDGQNRQRMGRKEGVSGQGEDGLGVGVQREEGRKEGMNVQGEEGRKEGVCVCRGRRAGRRV